MVAELHPGDVLFLPALWHHHVTTMEGPTAAHTGGSSNGGAWGVSVNVFWRHLPASFYEGKDLYGNRDLAQVGVAGV